MSEPHILYAVAHSLYSGRARSYMIKNGIAFVERSTGHPSFREEVLPKAKLASIPVVVTNDGAVIRDGAAIIDHFEATLSSPCQPTSPIQKLVSALFDVVGAEGLLRPAMHYRWNFPEQNLDFLRLHFLHSQAESEEREAKTDHMMNKMRQAGAAFGVSEQTIPLVETLYIQLLDALNKHFKQSPYLLGWQACIGDFGMIAPLYAHLGRDPKPLSIMQQQAPHVYRWVERMNRADDDACEFFNSETGYFKNDEIPQSLIKVLQVIAQDFVPETAAAAQCTNQWLADNAIDSGQKAERFVGIAAFEVQGQAMHAAAQPYRFYLLQRVQDCFAAMSNVEQTQCRSILEECAMAELLDIKLSRRLAHKDNLPVWL